MPHWTFGSAQRLSASEGDASGVLLLLFPEFLLLNASGIRDKCI
jgi:hypothetical protein